MIQNKATLGKSLHIKGEVSGSEDLVIDGRVEGTIDLKGNNLTVGPEGQIDADIHVRNVTISGQVRGNVVARDRIEIVDKGSLVGNIKSPRWTMSDDAQFKGKVDMGGSDSN